MMARLFLLFFIFSNTAYAIRLTQTVSNDVLFDLSLIAPTDAGDYFSTRHTSSSRATRLSISGIPAATEWVVYAKISHEIKGVKVKIKRTGNGSGRTIPTGNTSNRVLGITETKLFSGKGSRTHIPMQTEIDDISVGDGFGTLGTDIIFTIKTLE
jgi:hypothetical protein